MLINRGLLTIGFRNMFRNLSKRLAVMIIFVVSLTLLIFSNTVLEQSQNAIKSSYIDSFTAQAVIMQKTFEPYSLFGSTVPLVGDDLEIPLLKNLNELDGYLSQDKGVSLYSHQNTFPVKLEVDDAPNWLFVFNTETDLYHKQFPKVQFPPIDPQYKRYILLNDYNVGYVESRIRRPLVIGEEVTITVSTPTSYVIRSVKYAGIFKRPGNDPMSDRMCLVDQVTGQELLGGRVSHESTSQQYANVNEDELFGSDAPIAINSDPAPDSASSSAKAQWQYVLVSLKSLSDFGRFKSELEAKFQDLTVLDFKQAGGGMAQLVETFRVVLNIALLLVLFVSSFIIVNVISLSILERRKEIGSMRALGAQKIEVAFIVGLETLILIGLMGIVSSLASLLLFACWNLAGLSTDNIFLRSLFGSRVLTIGVSAFQLALHFGLSLLLGGLASLRPILFSLKLSPREAIEKV